jgi:hypothetical protein
MRGRSLFFSPKDDTGGAGDKKKEAKGEEKKVEEKKVEKKDGEGGDPPEKKEEVKFDLKLPKDSKRDPEFVNRVSAAARELGLNSNEHGQKLLDLVHKEADEYLQARTKAYEPEGEEWNAMTERWTEEVKNDKELGGKNFQQSSELAKRVAATFFGDKVHAWLHNTGLGSHPDLIRGLVKIGKAMREDQFVPSEGEGSKDTKRSDKKSPAKLLYGKKQEQSA